MIEKTISEELIRLGEVKESRKAIQSIQHGHNFNPNNVCECGLSLIDYSNDLFDLYTNYGKYSLELCPHYNKQKVSPPVETEKVSPSVETEFHEIVVPVGLLQSDEYLEVGLSQVGDRVLILGSVTQFGTKNINDVAVLGIVRYPFQQTISLIIRKKEPSE